MNNTSNLINILITDGNKIFRDGLALTLKEIAYVERVSQTDNNADTLNELKNNRYDIVFIDHYPPFLDGASCTHTIKLNHPQTKVICITIYNEEEHIIDMVKNGVDGYLLNSTDRTEIEIAIINVLKGRHYFSKDIPTELIDKILEDIIPSPARRLKKINKRETEILKLIYEEHTSREIADKLFISERTVEFYRQTLIKKTGSRNIVGVIKYAITNSLIKES